MHGINVDPVGRIALNPLNADDSRASAWDLYEVREWARAFRSRGLELKQLDPKMRERVYAHLIQGDEETRRVQQSVILAKEGT